MLNMKNTFLAALLLSFFGLSSCDKGPVVTIINATVKDSKTGSPVVDAKIECQSRWETSRQGSLISHTDYRYFNSDKNGKFSFSYDDEKPFSITSISKSGYQYKEPSYNLDLQIKKGEENNITIRLVPQDGYLGIHLENQTGVHDSIWFYVTSPTIIKEKLSRPSPKNGPSVLQAGQSVTAIFPMTTEEMATIHWDFKKPGTAGAAFRDSVFLVKYDTTIFNLKF